jgi:hypothetical protein
VDEEKAPEPKPMAVSWYEGDPAPLPTDHLIQTVVVRANTDGRQLKVMKTADAPETLTIYVDVP